MKTLRLLILVGLFALLTPGVARADDGGWLDWLFRLDPKLFGVNSEIHFLCFDTNNQPVRCEEFFLIGKLLAKINNRPYVPTVYYSEIRHELNFRFAYYHDYGDRFSDDPSDQGSINAAKLMLFYTYHPDMHLTVGFGAGYLPMWGAALPHALHKGIVTPLSVVYGPWTTGDNIWKKSFVIHTEASYIMGGLNGQVLGNNTTKYAVPGEWNFSFGTGFDFRRRLIGTSRPKP
jgi:hypothetical protein